MRRAGLDDMKEGVRIGGRLVNDFRHADDTVLLAESEEDLKKILRRVIIESG